MNRPAETRHRLQTWSIPWAASNESDDCTNEERPARFLVDRFGLRRDLGQRTNGIRHWPSLSFMLKVCDAIFLVAGLTLLVAGAWLLLIRTNRRAAAMLGAAAAGVFAVALAAGIWSGVIPCSSPG